MLKNCEIELDLNYPNSSREDGRLIKSLGEVVSNIPECDAAMWTKDGVLKARVSGRCTAICDQGGLVSGRCLSQTLRRSGISVDDHHTCPR